MQDILLQAKSLSGSYYWGIFADGAGVVYSGDCSANPACTTAINGLEIQINTASIGAYAIYADIDPPLNANIALQIVMSVYPALYGLEFAPVETADGYAFAATTGGLTGNSAASVKVIYAGIVGANQSTLIYAVVALGEGYVEIPTSLPAR